MWVLRGTCGDREEVCRSRVEHDGGSRKHGAWACHEATNARSVDASGVLLRVDCTSAPSICWYLVSAICDAEPCTLLSTQPMLNCPHYTTSRLECTYSTAQYHCPVMDSYICYIGLHGPVLSLICILHYIIKLH